MYLLANKYHRALEELGIVEWITDGAANNETEFRENFRKVVGVDENGNAILSSDENDWGFTWETLSAKADEIESGDSIRLLRKHRDRLIAETDWWVLPDRTPTDEQLAYRQALRDITDTYTSLDDVVWPTKPA